MSAVVHERKPNRLVREKSPYLLQHAYNPVDWFPWGEEALERARREDRPIFVSIGYSTCHWCHVMERESFDDSEVAKVLNEAFVCVKVDREERPDLDSLFMNVCQLMSQSCGWPLNVVLTPDLKPFFVASYIPKTSRYDQTGIMELVPKLVNLWRTKRADLEEFGRKLRASLEKPETLALMAELDSGMLDVAFDRLVMGYDGVHGGFGGAPKFPMASHILFLLRYWRRSGKEFAFDMVEQTLRALGNGGIYDQVGGGFHRYSTDVFWLVPHFEKMLYDQALLALAYTEAYQASHEEEFRRVATNTLEFVLRGLANAEGGFYSAVDADSEGEEGKFYLWTEQELRDVLWQEDADLAVHAFGIDKDGNYVDEVTGRRTGKNILRLVKNVEDLAEEQRMTLDDFVLWLDHVCMVLGEVRDLRVRPGVDDKVLSDWNGLMIAALARAGGVFDESHFVDAARKTADFVLANLRDEKGLLHHRWVKGERAVEGFLDDYAFLVFGLADLYEACFDAKYLEVAVELADKMVERFWDSTNGGFVFVGGGEQVLAKRRELYDGSVPSGNSVAFLCLQRLSQLTGNLKYNEYAVQSGRTFSEQVRGMPESFTFFLCGVDYALGPCYSVVLASKKDDDSLANMREALHGQYLPNVATSLRLHGEPVSRVFGSAVVGGVYELIEDKPTAYVCNRLMCLPATNSDKKMLELLGVKLSV